ncbi:MAG TPA: PLP-dependent aminotransferase family protein [Solirubrobacteraceae bacterium]|nr:PLP-dependent aminotransferase family protein [Solirubrobacteraceae bacterium]
MTAMTPSHDALSVPDPATSALERRLAGLERAGARSLTAQIVGLFLEAIASGELPPGAKLPPTRRLAAVAGINQLTATRCYRRLQDLGAVVSEVGRGTFVRAGGAASHELGRSSDASWQSYVLPPDRTDQSDAIVSEIARHVEDPRVIPLSAGYPALDLLPLEELRAAAAAAIERHGARSFQYGPIEGVSELREALAQLGRQRGLDDDADSIVVTTGARQALTLTARATLRPGDKVACESPTFMGIIEALRSAGAEVFPVPVDAGGLDTEALEQLLRRHEIRLLATQPRLQNPTGADLAPERRTRVVELALQHGFFILEDAVYGDLRFEGADVGPLRPLAPTHVIYVDSLSKTVGPGLRAGWVAASGPVLDRIAAEKRRDDAHGATLTQQTTAGFLMAGLYPAQIERARARYRENRDVLLEALDRELDGLVDFVRPAGGGHVWVTLRHALDDAQLYRDCLAAGVTFVPGPAMLVARPRATHMRLSYGLPDKAMLREGVSRLAGVIRASAAATPQRRSLPVT